MKINDAQFIKSAPTLKDVPDFGGLPEVALVGRSNVGKSSFINSLLLRKGLAQTSNTPGKTRLINLYDVNFDEDKKKMIFADLPGYGYAKRSKTEQAQWQKNFQIYLSRRDPLRLVVQLLDARHLPQDSDIQMLDWLSDQERPVMLVLTKTDKLKKSELARHVTQTARALEIEEDMLLPYSAETNRGREEVWAFLRELQEDASALSGERSGDAGE